MSFVKLNALKASHWDSIHNQ